MGNWGGGGGGVGGGSYLSRLFTGRLKLGLLACLFDLLVLGQTVGVCCAHAACALFFLAEDFAGTTGRLRELGCRLDLAATLRFWVPEKPGHHARGNLSQLCQVKLSHLSTLLSSYSLFSPSEPIEITALVY